MSAGNQQFLAEVMEQVAITLAGLRLGEALQAQSIKDPLTGAFNRRYMESTLEREKLRASPKGIESWVDPARPGSLQEVKRLL